jgi:hypothetical protein
MTDHDCGQTGGAASRRGTPAGQSDRDAPQVAESRGPNESASPDEPKYASRTPGRPAPERYVPGLTGRATPEGRRTPEGTPRVIVPPTPPDFGPAAARALIRLLIAVHRKHTNADNPSEET